MDIGLFTYVTGIATLLGFVLQIRDVFPEHRELRKSIVLVIMGIFVGTLLGTLQRINVTIVAPLTWFPVLVAVLLLILFVILVGALFAQENQRRKQLYIAFSWFLIAVLVVLLVGTLITRESPKDTESLSVDELLILVDSNVSRGNYDAAIRWLEFIRAKVSMNDPRSHSAAKRIVELKQKQLVYPQPLLNK
jgi:hypothetical protein